LNLLTSKLSVWYVFDVTVVNYSLLSQFMR